MKANKVINIKTDYLGFIILTYFKFLELLNQVKMAAHGIDFRPDFGTDSSPPNDQGGAWPQNIPQHQTELVFMKRQKKNILQSSSKESCDVIVTRLSPDVVRFGRPVLCCPSVLGQSPSAHTCCSLGG